MQKQKPHGCGTAPEAWEGTFAVVLVRYIAISSSRWARQTGTWPETSLAGSPKHPVTAIAPSAGSRPVRVPESWLRERLSFLGYVRRLKSRGHGIQADCSGKWPQKLVHGEVQQSQRTESTEVGRKGACEATVKKGQGGQEVRLPSSAGSEPCSPQYGVDARRASCARESFWPVPAHWRLESEFVQGPWAGGITEA